MAGSKVKAYNVCIFVNSLEKKENDQLCQKLPMLINCNISLWNCWCIHDYWDNKMTDDIQRPETKIKSVEILF